MLEASLKQLTQRILEVERSHLDNNEKKEMFSHNWEFIFFDHDGWVVLRVSSEEWGGYWMHPTLYPESTVDKLKAELPRINIDSSSVAYSHVTNSDDHWIEPFWEEEIGFDKSEIELFFSRHYDGRPKGKENYLEFNQIVTHPLDLHWSPTKNSYCVLNSLGDEVEKIKLVNENGVELILIRRITLDKLLHLGKWVLVRYFNFQRCRTEQPSFNKNTYTTISPEEYEGKFEMRVCGDEFVEFRGAQLERPITPKEKALSLDFHIDEEDEKKYGCFIVHDWRNGNLLKDYSIEPDNFANYYTESDLPYETSPIFFKGEVLDKYKNNPDKYNLNEGTISCRGSWYIQRYGINEQNQVHVYAIDLGRLPYKEQLHWLQYNENPRGPISQRSFETDFEAKWPDKPSKMEALKSALEKLSEIKVGKDLNVWQPKGGRLDTALRRLHMVNTENPNQWHDFIIALANATIEGFQTKPLRKIAEYFGNPGKELGTLGLIKHILNSTNEEKNIEDTYEVLNDIQVKRGNGKVHGNWVTPKGSLIEDSHKSIVKVTQAIKILIEIFENLTIEENEV